MSDTKTIADLERQLAVQVARYDELEKLIPLLEKEKNDLHRYGYGGDSGTIQKIRYDLAKAKREYEKLIMPEVRIGNRHDDSRYEIWRFVKKTEKRIYLRGPHRDEHWELDGTRRWEGSIHPDDLARILDGTIGDKK